MSTPVPMMYRKVPSSGGRVGPPDEASVPLARDPVVLVGVGGRLLLRCIEQVAHLVGLLLRHQAVEDGFPHHLVGRVAGDVFALLVEADDPVLRVEHHDQRPDGVQEALDEVSLRSHLQFGLLPVSDVDEGDDDAVHLVVDRAVRPHADQQPPPVVVLDLLLERLERVQNGPGIGQEAVVLHVLREVGEGPPGVGLADAEVVADARREPLHTQVPVEKQRGDGGRLHQVAEVAVGVLEFTDLGLEFLIGGLQFFVDRLKLFLAGLDLLVLRLELFVHREQFLVGGLQLLGRRLVLFDRVLKLLFGLHQLTLQLLHALSVRHVGLVPGRLRARRDPLQAHLGEPVPVPVPVEGAHPKQVRRRRVVGTRLNDRRPGRLVLLKRAAQRPAQFEADGLGHGVQKVVAGRSALVAQV